VAVEVQDTGVDSAPYRIAIVSLGEPLYCVSHQQYSKIEVVAEMAHSIAGPDLVPAVELKLS
jgi:hypothetical protein